MSSVRNDIIGGFNSLLADQQALPGECTVTLVQFDGTDPYDVLRDMVNIQAMNPLGKEYSPRGMTPLYDAMGRGIVNTGEKLAAMPEEDRPSKVVFVVLTDGAENASREYTKSRVAEMVKEQTEKYGWHFVFLGANQDAILKGGEIGVSAATSADYDHETQTSGVLKATSDNLRMLRSGQKSDMAYSAKQRQTLKPGS